MLLSTLCTWTPTLILWCLVWYSIEVEGLRSLEAIKLNHTRESKILIHYITDKYWITEFSKSCLFEVQNNIFENRAGLVIITVQLFWKYININHCVQCIIIHSHYLHIMSQYFIIIFSFIYCIFQLHKGSNYNIGSSFQNIQLHRNSQYNTLWGKHWTGNATVHGWCMSVAIS